MARSAKQVAAQKKAAKASAAKRSQASSKIAPMVSHDAAGKANKTVSAFDRLPTTSQASGRRAAQKASKSAKEHSERVKSQSNTADLRRGLIATPQSHSRIAPRKPNVAKAVPPPRVKRTGSVDERFGRKLLDPIAVQIRSREFNEALKRGYNAGDHG